MPRTRAALWRTLVLGTLLGLVVAPSPAAAQLREDGRRPIESPGMDFRPDGAWRKRAERVRVERRTLLRAGDLDRLNRAGLTMLRGPFAVRPYAAIGPAVTGRYIVPVIPVAYGDTPVNYPVSEFREVLFGATPPAGRPYTLKSYYEELSRGRIEMDGVVFDPVPHTETAAFITDGCNGVTIPGRTACPRPDNQNRMGRMLLATLDSISLAPGGDTIWSQFDNDGPDGLPNSGDDDGVVDFVTFLQPQVGGECTNSTGIWSHRYVISAWNNGSPYVTRTPRRDALGNPIPGQFLQVLDYTIQSQLGGATGCASGAIMPVGTVAHETGHAFGLPDLYDTSNLTFGVGDWSLMGFGNQVTQFSPSSYDPWSLFELGWITVALLEENATVTTRSRVLSDTVFLARAALANRQFVLIENRQAVGSDTAQMNPALITRRKMPGLLIWYVDELKILAGWNSNTVNSGAGHGVSLLQADGLNDLRGRRNRGDPGDPFPGSTGKTRFGLTTNPAARDLAGGPLGFAIDQIAQLPDGVMTFRYTRRQPSLVTSTFANASVVVDGLPYFRYEEIVAPGAPIAVSVEAQQLLLGGRTRATFLGWSNGGPRVQTVTSGATAPDTLIATLGIEYRLLAVTTGSGTVESSLPGNLANGIWLSEGLATTVTANAGPGVVFGGWTGDTISTNAALILPMHRPYDLTATFVVPVPVTVAEATGDLLGTGALTAQQRQNLDELGNRNGYYDLGDYLAMLNRIGLAGGAAR